MSQFAYKPYYERRLPHMQPPGATLFITFRLVGSIPAAVLEQLYSEAERVKTESDRISDPRVRAQTHYRDQRLLFGHWDTALALTSNGPFWLQDPRIAALVTESIHHRDGRVYDLIAYCMMPITYTWSLRLFSRQMGTTIL